MHMLVGSKKYNRVLFVCAKPVVSFWLKGRKMFAALLQGLDVSAAVGIVLLWTLHGIKSIDGRNNKSFLREVWKQNLITKSFNM
jgi:hypothetical protein